MFASCHEFRGDARALADDGSALRIRTALEDFRDFLVDGGEEFLDSLSEDAQASFIVAVQVIYRVLDELDPVDVVVAGLCVKADSGPHEHEFPPALRDLIQTLPVPPGPPDVTAAARA